jgi:hypothetical protein
MKKEIWLLTAAGGLLVLTGCQPVASPLAGVLYNETKFGWEATPNSNAVKEGKACANTIMGLVATGDASISAAKAAGGITEVAHIDHSAKSILGIVGEFCTIVKGK